MDDITLNLVKTALNIRVIEQQNAARNIASESVSNGIEVNFSDLYLEIKALDREELSKTLSLLNSDTEALAERYSLQTNNKVEIDEEHRNSIKAVIEYKALVEALNRRMSLKSIIYGGG